MDDRLQRPIVRTNEMLLGSGVQFTLGGQVHRPLCTQNRRPIRGARPQTSDAPDRVQPGRPTDQSDRRSVEALECAEDHGYGFSVIYSLCIQFFTLGFSYSQDFPVKYRITKPRGIYRPGWRSEWNRSFYFRYFRTFKRLFVKKILSQHQPSENETLVQTTYRELLFPSFYFFFLSFMHFHNNMTDRKNNVILLLSCTSFIPGLDPALPFFYSSHFTKRLTRNDAEFVDVIHTNAMVQGQVDPCGDVDFYVNGGLAQPACENSSSKCYGGVRFSVLP